jgi:hypothetical protein
MQEFVNFEAELTRARARMCALFNEHVSVCLSVCLSVWRSAVYFRVRRAGEGLTSKCTGNASTSTSSNPSTSTSNGLNGASAAPTDNFQPRLASTCFLQRPSTSTSSNPSTSTSIAVNAASAAPTDNFPAPDAANPETQSPSQWFRSRTVPKGGLMGLSRCCVAAPGTNYEKSSV